MSQKKKDQEREKDRNSKGLLSDGERKFLHGKKNNPGYRSRIKDKTQKIPKHLSRTIKDIRLLDRKEYLNEEILERILEEITTGYSLTQLLLSDYVKNTNGERPISLRPSYYRWGAEIGYLASLPSSINEKRKMLTLIGLHDALFDIISDENPEETKQNLKKLEKTLQDLKESYKSIDKSEMIKGLKKTREIIRSFFEKKKIDKERYEPVVKSLSYNITLEKCRNSKDGIDKELIRVEFKKYAKEHQIIERFAAAKSFNKHISKIKRDCNWRGLNGIEVFKAGFKENKGSSRDIIKSKLNDKRGYTYKGLITKVIKDIEKLNPKILKKEGNDYKLTDYGKCLRDYLKWQEKGTEKLLPAMKNLSDYWRKVLDEHFSTE